MSQLCCHDCRVRFTPEAGEYLLVCPQCDRPTTPIEALRRLVGYRLFDPRDLTDFVSDGPGTSPPRRRGTPSR